MDEVTSALDPHTAKTMIDRILNIKETQTIICVTHDFNVLRFFDRIILVEELGVLREIQKDQINDLENLIA